MKKNRVFAVIAAAVITASIATTACLTASALRCAPKAKDVFDSGVTAPQSDVFDSGVTAPQSDVFDSGVTAPQSDVFDSGVTAPDSDIICGMPNPFTDCGYSYEKAQKIAGFEFGMKEFSNYSIQAKNDMIEVWVKQHDDKGVTYRKCSDLSYAQAYQSVIDDLEHSASNYANNPYPNAIFGTKDGKVHNVYFSDGEFSYSIHWDEPVDFRTAIDAMGPIFVLN